MEIRAYGFSVTPSTGITASDLLAEFAKLNGTRRNLAGKYRVFVVAGNPDQNHYFRAGVLSIRDEKIALEFVNEGGELTITPATIEREQLDFNLILLRSCKDGVIRGVMTSYRGALSMSLFEQRLRVSNRRSLRTAIKEQLEHSKSGQSVTSYIEENELEDTFVFQRLVSDKKFIELVASLDDIKYLDVKFERYHYPDASADELLSKDIEVIHSKDRIKFQGSPHGLQIARKIKRFIEKRRPSSAIIHGVLGGKDEPIDYWFNPTVLWESDLDQEKLKLKIKLKDFLDNPIFDELSRKFADDPRFE